MGNQAVDSHGASTEKVIREANLGIPKISLARRGAWTLDIALKLREELQQQHRNPEPEMNRRLNDVADRHAEALGTDISKPCRLKKFSVKLKDGAQFVAMVPRLGSDSSEPVLQEIKKQYRKCSK